ncbi:MAG: hypothetical protein KDB68_15390 [Planctomycetes bacterium]|nr:hypothetical protein [Planctomycetota bacterium]
MKPYRWLAFALCASLLMSACAQEADEEEEVKPIEITPGLAVAEPATPADPAVDPAVAYDGTRVHMVYSQWDGASQYNLMYTQRIGAGNFTAPASVFPASAADSRDADIFLDGTGTLHMVWAEGTSPNREIYYATRNNGGTFTTPQPLTTTSEDEANPRVHVDSTGRVHVIWQGSTPPPSPTSAIFYRRTQSTVFLSAVILPKGSGNQPAEMPDLCTDRGDRIYVVWAESNGTSRDIRMVRSDDNGQNFGGVGSGFAATGSVDMTQPRVQGGLDGEVFLVFVGQAVNGDRALFATYTRTGGTFVDPGQLLTSETGGIRDPELAAFKRSDDNYTLMVACNDGPVSGGNILIKSSHDNAENWPGDPINLSQGNTQPSTNVTPVLALDDNELIACWAGQPTGAGVVRTWTSASDYTLP